VGGGDTKRGSLRVSHLIEPSNITFCEGIGEGGKEGGRREGKREGGKREK